MAHVPVQLFLTHFDMICDLPPNRCIATIIKEFSSGTYKTSVYQADK